MRCYSCNTELSIKEELANTEEAFIENKCLCKQCLSISNEEVNRILNENNKK